MTLDQWYKNSWLRKHSTSKQELSNLFAIVDRDLASARQKDLSDDWRFGIAYNAALKLCTILLYSEGYRAERNLAHFRTLASLPLILGSEKESDSKYLDLCRRKRHIVEYEYVGGVTKTETDEFIEFVSELQIEVLAWLNVNHKELL